MRELALFAGAGGGILASTKSGRRIVCAVERDAYAAQILAQRQNDGALPAFPIWSDVCSFDGYRWRGVVDCISGGFPCQDISIAGNGDGLEGSRSSMWFQMARIIGEVRPTRVEVENSPMLTSRGLGTVLGDLASLGYDCRWGVVSAASAGAPHLRERIWILANAERMPCSQQHQVDMQRGWADQAKQTRMGSSFNDIPNSGREYVQGIQHQGIDPKRWAGSDSGPLRSFHLRPGWWTTEPSVGRVADGVANRMDRLKALGNGQVPHCVNLAWKTLEKIA